MAKVWTSAIVRQHWMNEIVAEVRNQGKIVLVEKLHLIIHHMDENMILTVIDNCAVARIKTGDAVSYHKMKWSHWVCEQCSVIWKGNIVTQGSKYRMRTGQHTEVQEQCKQHMPTKGATQHWAVVEHKKLREGRERGCGARVKYGKVWGTRSTGQEKSTREQSWWQKEFNIKNT